MSCCLFTINVILFFRLSIWKTFNVMRVLDHIVIGVYWEEYRFFLFYTRFPEMCKFLVSIISTCVYSHYWAFSKSSVLVRRLVLSNEHRDESHGDTGFTKSYLFHVLCADVEINIHSCVLCHFRKLQLLSQFDP